MKCTHCHSELDYGKDALLVEEGVVGPPDFYHQLSSSLPDRPTTRLLHHHNL